MSNAEPKKAILETKPANIGLFKVNNRNIRKMR